MKPSSLQLPASPPLLLGAGLLVWGWQCDFPAYAVIMALILESARFFSWRWAITDKEFNTLSDFSGVMFFLTVIIIFSNEGARGIFVILGVLPFILFPLVLTQIYSQHGTMKLSALLVSLRKLDPAQSPEAETRTNVSLPYFIICLLAASTGNQRTIWFFIAISLLTALLLWSVRPRRYSSIVWLGALLLSLSIAYAGQIGLRQLQASIEVSFLGFFDQFMWRYRDPNRTTTAIGSLGRLKLSDRIVLRLKTKDSLQKPLLLREASYNTFGHGVWTNQHSDFSVIDQNTNGGWTLIDGVNADKNITLSTYMIKEKGVIPLPHASSEIKNVAAIEIQKNPQGTVLMDIREGWIQYDVEYTERISNELPPDENDLKILPYYREDFDRLAGELALSSLSEPRTVDTIYRFFQKNFKYSLNQQQRYPKGKYLADFLFKNRQGHCEYFATATALLLRSAGIPSRYVVGYSIDEYSTLERQYIGRARHAHSWTLAYVNNQWQVLDTTPSIWAPYEEENASAMEPLMDIWLWLSYTWSRWQSEDLSEEGSYTDFLLWLLIPLMAILAWKMYFKKRVQLGRQTPAVIKQVARPGIDSSFYQLTALIELSGLPRHPGETLSAWFRRIENKIRSQRLRDALQLHYKYRFDPGGLSSSEMTELKQLVSDLLSRKQEWLMAAPG